MKILGFVSSNLEGRVFTVGSVRRLAYGKPLDCSTGKYATRERPSIGVRRPSIDVHISQWVDYQPFWHSLHQSSLVIIGLIMVDN